MLFAVRRVAAVVAVLAVTAGPDALRPLQTSTADTTASTSCTEMPNRRVHSWVSSKAADRTQELTLDQLKLLCRTGTTE
ncbi:hypothetical protein GA0074694_5351 [Micromonospora inyonensis]|uniref:Secreted protein n=2 Tax=Micromonospora inyonensis TaxID=47866 RepID=A0A1C6SIK1_9ACTN|nr:hypothetical protein GA0074694_5351 [Micromonospora inyonensis]